MNKKNEYSTSSGNISQMNEIKKHIINILNIDDKNNNLYEWKDKFEGFLETRKIQEEDYSIIAELYTYPNDTFIKFFHNEIYYQKENLGKMLKNLIENPSTDRETGLKRFFELFLQFFEKYDWVATDQLNRVMECKKEYKRGSENRGEENSQIKNEIQITNDDFIREKNQKETQEKIRTEYIPLFEKTYKNLENKEDSSQLQECKRNAKAYIEKGLEEDFERDVNEMEKIGKLSRGERFLFDTSTGKHIKMDREEFRDINWLNKKELETFKNVNNIKKQDMYIRLHIDQGANFGELTDILYKMKIFLDTYTPRDKIRYTIIVSWLRNSEFIEYYRKWLKDHKIIKPSNIIKIYDETKNYLAKQGRFQNMAVEGGYNEFKEQFIIKDKDPAKQSSLNQALEAYEKEGKKLKEGCVILDLDKIKKMKK